MQGLPETLVCHALGAGYDVETPMTDPNSFLSCLEDPAIQDKIKIRFVMLHAPAIVTPSLMKELVDLPGIKEAYDLVDRLDLIVSSAGVTTDKHSMLSKYYKHDAAERLRKDGCLGDMLWLPLACHGPIDNSKYPYRSMPLIELSMLPSRIRGGTHVLLVVGPCSLCGNLKTEILDTILDLGSRDIDKRMVTHVVVDSRTTRDLFERLHERGE